MALLSESNRARIETIGAAPSRSAPDERAAFAAQFVPAGTRVLELNCGRMALRQFLPYGCQYRGCDLVARRPDTLVCDLNAGEFPTEAAAEADIIVMLGALETIIDAESLFTHPRFVRHDIVLSYCATDLTGQCNREGLGFVNHFSFFDLVRLFERFGLRIEYTASFDGVQTMMRLAPVERTMTLSPCRVAVVSEGAQDFGSRLGLDLI